MDKGAIQSWAERFVADLNVGGERVPLDRVIAAHLPVLESLRASGLTWRSIAAIIARAGGRRANGHPISPDQLRADVSRLIRRRVTAPAIAAASMPSPSHSPDTSHVALRPAKARAASPPARPRSAAATLPNQSAYPPIATPAGDSKDVSDSDIAAALIRLKLRS